MKKHIGRRGRARDHRPTTAAERMRRMRARRRAAGFVPVTTWVRLGDRRSAPPLDVRMLQARSLALHVIAAMKIDARPEWLDIANRCVAAWRRRGSGTPGAAIRAWRKALRLPWPVLSKLMTEQSEEAVALRSVTPFLHVLTPIERRRVYDGFRALRTRTPPVPTASAAAS